MLRLKTPALQAVAVGRSVIMEPSVYKNSERHKFDSVADHPAARRKAVFKDVRNGLRYKDRMPYNLWQDAVFKDYYDLVSCLGQLEGLTWLVLLMEASIYMANELIFAI